MLRNTLAYGEAMLRDLAGSIDFQDQKEEDGGHNGEDTQAVLRVVYLHGPEGRWWT